MERLGIVIVANVIVESSIRAVKQKKIYNKKYGSVAKEVKAL